MSANPDRYWRVCWTECFREAEQERNFKSAGRAARQCAAILACPDEVAKLRTVAVTSGFANDRLGWTELDPRALIESVGASTPDSDLDPDSLSPSEWLDTVRESWRVHQERTAGGGPGSPVAPSPGESGTDAGFPVHEASAAPPPVRAPSAPRREP